MNGVEKKERTYTFPFDEADRSKKAQRFQRKMFKLKEGEKTYPWPCDADPDRTITVNENDLFSKTKDGTVIKHTGVGCYGIIIPDEDLEETY